MSAVLSGFDKALTYIKDKYPFIKFSMITDPETFAPILGFSYNDILVSRKLSGVDIMDKDKEYWIDFMEELLIPIKRDLKIDNILE